MNHFFFQRAQTNTYISRMKQIANSVDAFTGLKYGTNRA